MKSPEDQKPTIQQVTEHLFRHESGKMISILTGIYGSRNLQLAEDVVQEAMIRALKTWPFGGVPANPVAWLLRTAKNLAIDHLRRENNLLGKLPEIIAETSGQSVPVPLGSEEEFSDDQLRLMFVCCHPDLTQETQVAIALKTLFGFSPGEIATAFLISEAAVAKRLVRARQRIRDQHIPFEIPEVTELPVRLDGVLETLYLLFNEGHKATSGDEVVRRELCLEALRMASLLASHPVGNYPRTHALAALMAFTAARLAARTDAEGCLVRLEDQDREKWDRNLIQAGIHHLAESSGGNDLSEFHLQAGIAACHTLAPSDAGTDWPRIIVLYDKLLEQRSSPVIGLNRAVAISRVRGAQAGIEELKNAEVFSRLDRYHLYHAVLGELEWKCERNETAAAHFRRALELAETKPERVLLAKRLEDCLG